MNAPASPYRTVEVAPGHLRQQADFAASRAIAADIVARERAQLAAGTPIWRKLMQRFSGKARAQ